MKYILIYHLRILFLSILVLFLNSCDDEDVLLPVVQAEFTHTINQNNGKVTFINTSANANTYHWSFGNGKSSTEINPIQFYETGEYVVTLEARHASGASNTFSDTIEINIPLPVTVPFDFDEQNVAYEPTVFEGASFEVVVNPSPSGSNTTTGNVGAITNSGKNWEGIFFTLGEPIDLANQKSIRMDFWSDKQFDVLLKLENGTAANIETTANHGGSGWEELIFTFNSDAKFPVLTMFADGPGTSEGTFYFDHVEQIETVDLTSPMITLNGDATIITYVGATFTDPGATAVDDVDMDITEDIVVGGDVVDTSVKGTYVISYNVTDMSGNAAAEVIRTIIVTDEPLVSAPMPTSQAENVLAVYSDSYNLIPITTYDPPWGQSGHMQVNTTYDPGDGNFAMAYRNFNYQGTQFDGSQDLADMDMVHIDLWTINATNIQFTPISQSTGEKLVSLSPIKMGEWNSYDIPLSDFTGLSFQDIHQLKFDGQAGVNPSDIWLDNIYFYKSSNGSGGGGSGGCNGDLVAATSMPVNFESCETFPANINFGSGLSSELVANPFKEGINNSDYVLKVVKEKDAEFFAGIQNNFSEPFDLSNPTHKFKMKIYSTKPNTVFRFEVAQDNPDVGNPPPAYATVTEANEWQEVEFKFAGLPAPKSYFRLVIKPDDDGTESPITQTGTYYIDDIDLLE